MTEKCYSCPKNVTHDAKVFSMAPVTSDFSVSDKSIGFRYIEFLTDPKILLPILLLSWLFLVLQRITLGFDSMGDCLYGFWTTFLQVVAFVVFVCEPVEMHFLRRSCVFFSISLLFIVVFVFYNVVEVSAMLESRVVLFIMILS